MILDLENRNLKVLDLDESEGFLKTMIFLGGTVEGAKTKRYSLAPNVEGDWSLRLNVDSGFGIVAKKGMFGGVSG